MCLNSHWHHIRIGSSCERIGKLRLGSSSCGRSCGCSFGLLVFSLLSFLFSLLICLFLFSILLFSQFSLFFFLDADSFFFSSFSKSLLYNFLISLSLSLSVSSFLFSDKLLLFLGFLSQIFCFSIGLSVFLLLSLISNLPKKIGCFISALLSNNGFILIIFLCDLWSFNYCFWSSCSFLLLVNKGLRSTLYSIAWLIRLTLLFILHLLILSTLSD